MGLQGHRDSLDPLDPRDKWDPKVLHCIREVEGHKDLWDHKGPRAHPKGCQGLRTYMGPKECKGILDLMALWDFKDHLGHRVILVLKVIWVPKVYLAHKVTLAPKAHLVPRGTWALRDLLVLKVCRGQRVPEECKDLLILMGYKVGQGLRGSKVLCLRDL